MQLTEQTAVRPVVSPDGKWIAFFTPDAKQLKLAVMPFAGGKPFVVETDAAPEHQLVRWRPDSRALCYIVTRQGVSNLWSQALDGGAAQPLTRFTSEQIFHFAWSRDGQTLACERGLTISDAISFTRRPAE